MSVVSVVGGTYFETCVFPRWRRLYGSGGRAAGALARLGATAQLTTWWDPAHMSELRRLGAENGFTIAKAWPAPVVHFDYLHGLRATGTTPPRWTLGQQEAGTVECDSALVFGMVEGTIAVRARQAVFDPQASTAAKTPQASGVHAEKLAVVCNRIEAEAITGESDLQRAAGALLRLPGVEAVVIKADASGALVATKRRRSAIGPIRTERVFPIGSGDVFSAAFAFHWLVNKRDPIESAARAGACVASYCGNGHLEELSPSFRRRAPTISPRAFNAKRKRVYLAGPFFDLGQRWLVDEAYDCLSAAGLDVFSPIHHVGHLPSAKAIARADLQGLRSADVVYAIVNGMDPGTIFEIGYAAKQGIPTVLYGTNLHDEDLTMLVGSGAMLEEDFPTSIYKARWAVDG